jgi:hypothetical protein
MQKGLSQNNDNIAFEIDRINSPSLAHLIS